MAAAVAVGTGMTEAVAPADIEAMPTMRTGTARADRIAIMSAPPAAVKDGVARSEMATNGTESDAGRSAPSAMVVRDRRTVVVTQRILRHAPLAATTTEGSRAVVGLGDPHGSR